jgi:hypothetical protein
MQFTARHALTATTLTLAAAFLVADAAACGSPAPRHAVTSSTAPALPTSWADQPTASPSAAPVYRHAAVGEAFTIPGWKVTVTAVKYGTTDDLLHGQKDIVDAPYMAIVLMTGVNTGTGPVAFMQSSDYDPQAYTAAGFDAQGRSYMADSWMAGAVNPGVSVPDAQVMFGTPTADVRLAKVAINDVLITLS